MQPPQKHSWINLAELKDQLTRKLGSERSNQYFDYLKRFLSLKLNKIEFNKLCLRTLGRENISLHNQLIRSILKNVCIRKVQPLRHDDHSTTVGNNKFSDEVYHENGYVPVVTQASTPLPPSSQKVAVNTKYSTESLGRNSGKEVFARTSLHAPLGIPHLVRKASSLGRNSKFLGILDINGLRGRMEQLAATQGLEGVSIDCASVLNNGLDAYLKGLIRSFAELSGARKNISIEPHAHLRPCNGLRPRHHYQLETRNWSSETMQEKEGNRPISLVDFTVAMELDPRQLGEHWPILLEKICTHAF
ncbi:uncharacterized protein LOC112508519 [Cynara cardunculus var. scolymus]|uniref:Transcriptional coactivator Hfi1/Transcriptional adapter 1 n=1 Tax=Cynara cardunculus var. scolymus TaxID=59895 RepID=A0A124SGE0_CYNCS|nr:uncharacterized protein LOC112508519 [Cynara cardunculus var. scolymus]KVI06103.1 Transcriptional coactivator Hfi1/Transcriptional adapter 1 [Cynara cardunculus var. scolymus]